MKYLILYIYIYIYIYYDKKNIKKYKGGSTYMYIATYKYSLIFIFSHSHLKDLDNKYTMPILD